MRLNKKLLEKYESSKIASQVEDIFDQARRQAKSEVTTLQTAELIPAEPVELIPEILPAKFQTADVRRELGITTRSKRFDLGQNLPNQVQQASQPRKTAQPLSSTIGFKLNFGQLVAAVLLFGLMFALPVYLFENRANFSSQPTTSYARTVTSQEGRVAGVSSNSTAQTNQAANRNTQQNIMGIPIGTALIIAGMLLITVPVFLLLRL